MTAENPDYTYDPEKSVLDNVYEAYDGEPPREYMDLVAFLDLTNDLLKQLEAGEITSEEFMQIHDRAAEALLENPDKKAN